MLNNTKYNLLYSEDEAGVREMVVEYLEEYFSTIYVAKNGKQALELYELYHPDIIITDIKMPKMNGLELAVAIRKQNKEIPIIITTAYTTTEYLLQAIELNLVKYLLKPVEEENLQEALTSAMERLETSHGSTIQLSQCYIFDMFSKILTQNKKVIALTVKQRDFLYLLLKNKEREVSYDTIQHYVWKDKTMSDTALRSLVYDLRNIIHKNIVQNVSKIGYQINLNG
jgi:DNA-binding response OmpR family regulator